MGLDADNFESEVKRFESFLVNFPSKYINGKKFDDLNGRVIGLMHATNPLIRESRTLVLVCRRLNEDVERIQREADEFYKKTEIPESRIILHGYFKNDPSQSGATLGLLMGYFEIDAHLFYVMLRSHLDSLARLIRLKYQSWGGLETSMHDLLKNNSELFDQDSKFHGKVVAELSWFENTKKFRDDFVHGNTYFVPYYDPVSKRIVLELYENKDLARQNPLGKYDLDHIRTEVNHLVSLYGFLENNLKFDCLVWVHTPPLAAGR